MIRELAQSSDGQWMVISSMLFFLTFFLSMAVYVFKTDSKKLEEYGMLPLKEDVPVDKH